MRRNVIIFSLLILIVFFIALLPTFFSSSMGKEILSKYLSKDLHIASLKLSWFGPQEMKGVTFKEFHADAITSDASLLPIIFKREIGTLSIVHPRAVLHEELSSASSTSSSPSSSSKTKKAKKDFAIPFTGHLLIENGEVEIQSLGVDKIAFTQITLDLHLTHALSSLHLSGVTAQESVSGHFDVDGKWNYAQNEGTISANLLHFPMKGVDQLISRLYPQLAGLSLESIGPSCDLKLQLNKAGENSLLSVNARSPYLNVNLEMVPQNDRLVLKNPTTLTWIVTPTLMAKISPVPFDRASKLQMNIQRLAFTPNAPLQTSIQADFEFQQTKINPQLTLDSLKGSINSSQLDKALDLSANGIVQFEGLSSRLDLTAHLENLNRGNFSLNGSSLPIKLVDQCLKQDGLLTTLLGPSLTLALKGNIDPLQSDLSLRAETLFLQLPSLELIIDKAIRLKSPTQLTYLPPPELMTEKVEMTLTGLNIPIEKPEALYLNVKGSTPKFFYFKEVQGELICNTLQKIELNLKEKSLQANLLASYNRNVFSLAKPLTIKGTLTNDLLSQINPGTTLCEPTPISLQIDPFSISLQKDLLSQIKLKGKGAIDILCLSNTPLPLNNISLQFQLDAKKQMIWLSLTAQQISAELKFDQVVFQSQIDTSQALFSSTVTLNQFPTSHLEAWTGNRFPFQKALGSVLDLQLKMVSSPKKTEVTFNTKSQFLNTEIALAVKDNFLVLQENRPLKFSFVLTEQGYQLINTLLGNQTASLTLAEKGLLKGQFNYLKLPVLIPQSSPSFFDRLPIVENNFQKIELQGNLFLDKLALEDKKRGQTAYLQNMNLDIDKKNRELPITLQLDGDISSKVGKKEGKVMLTVHLEHLFTDQGMIDHDHLIAHVNGSIQHLPTLILDAFAEGAAPSKLFGQTLDATLTADIQQRAGPLSLTIQSPNTRASLKGEVKQGMLMLSEPIYAQITMTPGVSAFLLHEANPLSISEISAQNPLTLQIDPEGFALPLFPFGLNRCAINSARLELGQIQCKNEGNLQFTMGLLKSKQFTQDGKLNLWFAPLDFQIQQNILNIQRTEILVVDTFDIALWGKIDLQKDYVDMVLGLTADCLKTAFGIKDLPKNYVLQIPMKGPSDNVQINKTAATAKIATLLAWQQKSIAGALGKGAGGGLFGELMKKVGPLPDFNSPAPPAKHPFPWEVEQPETPKKKNSRKTKINPKDKPLKQLLKFLH